MERISIAILLDNDDCSLSEKFRFGMVKKGMMMLVMIEARRVFVRQGGSFVWVLKDGRRRCGVSVLVCLVSLLSLPCGEEHGSADTLCLHLSVGAWRHARRQGHFRAVRRQGRPKFLKEQEERL